MRLSLPLALLAAGALALSTAPAQAQHRLASTGSPSPQTATPLVDVIQDGSFEDGTPNAFWTEFSLNFGTTLCDIPACGTGTGTGPRTGNWWSWFGGISTYEEGSVSQTVTLTPGTATLTFWTEAIVCDSAADYLEVLVDGTQEFIMTGADPTCGSLGYVEQTVNLDAYADGGTHTIEFHSEIFANNGGGTNFFVDDVVLENIVPVELTAFTAAANGSDVTLAWATASETNNAGFEVQMRQGGDWSPLGFVAGHGTTTEAQTYSYTAAGLDPGTYTFRLKQVDFDGAFEYSGEVEATVEVVGTHVLTQAYPNPFNPQAQFSLTVARDQHVSAALYNVLGQRVATLFDGTLEANALHALTIDGRALASGTYVVRIQGETFSDALRVTLAK